MTNKLIVEIRQDSKGSYLWIEKEGFEGYIFNPSYLSSSRAEIAIGMPEGKRYKVIQLAGISVRDQAGTQGRYRGYLTYGKIIDVLGIIKYNEGIEEWAEFIHGGQLSYAATIYNGNIKMSKVQE